MMDINTGKRLSAPEHIKQSIYNVILTPKGSRVLNRDYGSNVYEYLDQPINLVGPELGAEIVNSLNQGEKRIKVKKVKAKLNGAKGQYILEIIYNDNQTTNLTLNK